MPKITASLGYFLYLFIVACVFISCRPGIGEKELVQVFDDHLQLELIAEAPQIVTPIGMAFDQSDVLYVLESHTHSPPSGYVGPKTDLIKRAEDSNEDGIPDKWSIFARGIINGANLAIDSQGRVLVTAKTHLLAFSDLDSDGQSDQVDTLVWMDQPEYVYDHAGLLGVAFSPDGWIYCSRGNLGSKAWRLRAKDGTFLEGYGTGGLIFRCKPDGTSLEIVASGFWNPFDIKFTHEGRLMATDNDPDSRGPNRLLEIVQGGDYGFKCLYGGSGLHPFVAWNGELPGTLPMAAPLGEAPCALIDAQFTNFGSTYENQVLVNIWEEKNIVRIPLTNIDGSIRGEPQVLVQGDTTFHPVALASDSHGNLFISDWVKRAYPNHSHGRIWRLSSSSSQEPASKSLDRLQVQRSIDQVMPIDELFHDLDSVDLFQKAVIRDLIGKTGGYILPYLTDSNSNIRLEALLIMTKLDHEIPKETLLKLLRDDNVDIRRMALIYTGRHMRVDLKDEILHILSEGKIGSELFDTYLATIQHLQPEFIDNYRNRTGISTDKQKEKLPKGFIIDLIRNETVSENIRALALPYLVDFAGHSELLRQLLKQAKSEVFQVNLIQALKKSSGSKSSDLFFQISGDKALGANVRAEAILALNFDAAGFCAELMKLLEEEKSDAVKYALVKSLSTCHEIAPKIVVLLERENEVELLNIWNHAFTSKQLNTEQLADLKDQSGNLDRGGLVFQLSSSQCKTCHKINGWGGVIGPDLSNVGSSKSRRQLIDAILYPSREIAPEWQGWYVIDSSGSKHIGRQIDVHLNRAELMNLSGEFDNFPQPQGYGVLDQSVMPDGLYQKMTLTEFNDLVSYLESLH